MKYKYVGNGAGIPGLPHEISDEEAKGLRVEELLQDAIEAGVYVVVDDVQVAKVTAPRSQKAKTGEVDVAKE